MHPPRFLTRGLLYALAMFSICSSMASANLTSINAPFGIEATHAQIFANSYGGVFAPGPNGAAVYSNGTITATRIDDTIGKTGIGNNLNLVTGGPNPLTTDQIWEDGIAITSAEAKFAGYAQQFGYDDGAGYVNLFNVTGSGFNVGGSASHHFSQGVPWNWMRAGTGNMYYSENARNIDMLDHMVTYQITGLNTSDSVWMLFWEDRPGALRSSGGSDRDFNDLVVEIRGTVANIVPVPGAVILCGIGMAISGLASRRRSLAV